MLKWIYNLLFGIVFLITIVSAVVFTFSYYDLKYQECTSDPLVFAAKYYEEMYGYPFTGSGSFIGGSKTFSTIYFDKYNTTMKEPERKPIKDYENLKTINWSGIIVAE